MQSAYRFSLTAVVAAAGVSVILLTGPAQAQRPELPPAGDCAAMVAASGGKGIWYGQFSGRYEDEFGDNRFYPLAARGCFKSEYACRRWTNQLLSIGSESALMSCRPYNQAR